MMMSSPTPPHEESSLSDDARLTPAEPIPTPQSPALRKIFIGKHGLRAGWSLLIFLALLAGVLSCVNVIGHKLHPPAPRAANAEISAVRNFIGESIPFLAVLLVTWIMSKIERRPNSVYGLGGRRKLPHFIAGLAWGVTCLSLLVLALWKTGLLVFDSRLLFGGDILRYGAIWLFGFLLVGLNEEYFTRGYLQYTLTRGLAGFYQWAFKTRHSAALGFWTSAVIFSVIFCLSLWRTGSLWWAIGFHASWDWAQSFLYGVADSGTMIQHHLLATHPVGKPILSGGATGPEGSIFILATLALISLIILFTLPRAHYGDTADRST